jgi:hypothetical protein
VEPAELWRVLGMAGKHGKHDAFVAKLRAVVVMTRQRKSVAESVRAPNLVAAA